MRKTHCLSILFLILATASTLLPVACDSKAANPSAPVTQFVVVTATNTSTPTVTFTPTTTSTPTITFTPTVTFTPTTTATFVGSGCTSFANTNYSCGSPRNAGAFGPGQNASFTNTTNNGTDYLIYTATSGAVSTTLTLDCYSDAGNPNGFEIDYLPNCLSQPSASVSGSVPTLAGTFPTTPATYKIEIRNTSGTSRPYHLNIAVQ